MNLLLDTHLILWTADDSPRLSHAARGLIGDPANTLHFSAISIWEIGIKRKLDRPDFQFDPNRFRDLLRLAHYVEIDFTSAHGLAVLDLPLLHRDPFDRALIAQAACEGLTLLSSDRHITQYRGPVLEV